jgi:hypothetical protein
MRRFDPELIAALAEGSLDPERAQELEAAIADNPGAAEALAKQRAALEATRSAPAIALSETERSTLRSVVAEALGFASAPVSSDDTASAEPVPQVRFRPEPSRSIPWPALALAGAALLTLVAVVPIVGLLTTDGTDEVAATAPSALSLEDPASTLAEAPSDDLAGADADRAAIDDPERVEAPPEETLAAATAETTTTETLADEPTLDEAIALELAALRDDPEALGQLAAPSSPDTPCLAEASSILGSEDLSVFEYTPAPAPPPSSTTTSTTVEGETPEGSDVYRVFFVPSSDPEQGPGVFVAFDEASCENPYTLP